MLDDAEIGCSRGGHRRRSGAWTTELGQREVWMKGGDHSPQVHHRVHKRVERRSQVSTPRSTDDPLYARMLDI